MVNENDKKLTHGRTNCILNQLLYNQRKRLRQRKKNMKKKKSYRTYFIYQKLTFLNCNSFPREKEPVLTKQMHTHYFPDLVMLVYPLYFEL